MKSSINEWNQQILKNILERYSFINIFGEAGTGKTTLALQLLGNLLTFPEINNRSAVWVQASDRFPTRRLKSLFSHNEFLLQSLLRHIFIIPKKPAIDYYQQNTLLANLFRLRRRIPPNTYSLVIDNISHHLRYEIMQFSDINDTIAIMDDFFDSVIIPLTFFCEQSKMILILIHEVSYDPDQDKTVMFNEQLFNRINSLDIKMKKDLVSKKYYIHFHTASQCKSFEYKLQHKGIIIQT